MSKENKNKARAPSDRGSKKPWIPRAKPIKGLIDEVPVLTWNPSHSEPTNFPEFETAMTAYAGSRFDHMIYMFLNDSYKVVVEPKYKEDESPSAEPEAIQIKKFCDIHSAYVKQKNDMEFEKVKVYNTIRGNMSVESIERVESDPDFILKNVRTTQDPLELWKIVKKTHVRGRIFFFFFFIYCEDMTKQQTHV